MIKFQWVHCYVFLPLAHIYYLCVWICSCDTCVISSYIYVTFWEMRHTLPYVLVYDKSCMGDAKYMFIWGYVVDNVMWWCWFTCCLQRHYWFYVQKVSQMRSCLRAFYDDVGLFGRSISLKINFVNCHLSPIIRYSKYGMFSVHCNAFICTYIFQLPSQNLKIQAAYLAVPVIWIQLIWIHSSFPSTIPSIN